VENNTRWFGIPNRYLVLLLIVASIVIHYVFNVEVLQPHVQLPAENLFSIAGSFYLTNTLTATVLVDIILILIALAVRRAAMSGSLIPGGLSGAVEALLEVLYNLTESTAGKWTKKIFPWFATITLLVLVANWMELVPGVDSVGIFNAHHVHDFESICEETHIGSIIAVGGEGECSSAIVPFIRVASTDLNFTVALALISVVMIQVVGFQALGAGYFTKFWNTKTLFSKPIFGAIDFAVGLLEIVAEIAKVLSFSFRLFGNIFAGSVLLFVIGSLVPVFAQTAFLMLEFFVGLIQAVVFGMLTMVFMSQATQSHHDGEEHH